MMDTPKLDELKGFVKWVKDRDELHKGATFANIAYPEEAVPVITLDEIEAWLDTQRYARAADGLHVCVEDLLAQVQAMKEGKT